MWTITPSGRSTRYRSASSASTCHHGTCSSADLDMTRSTEVSGTGTTWPSKVWKLTGHRAEGGRPPTRLPDVRPGRATPCVRATAGEDVENRGESLGTIALLIEVANHVDAGCSRRTGQHGGTAHLRGPSWAQLQDPRTAERHTKLLHWKGQPLERVSYRAMVAVHAEDAASRIESHTTGASAFLTRLRPIDFGEYLDTLPPYRLFGCRWDGGESLAFGPPWSGYLGPGAAGR
jgi:hypothetical protein